MASPLTFWFEDFELWLACWVQGLSKPPISASADHRNDTNGLLQLWWQWVCDRFTGYDAVLDV